MPITNITTNCNDGTTNFVDIGALFCDLSSNQTIDGNKTFSGTSTFTGRVDVAGFFRFNTQYGTGALANLSTDSEGSNTAIGYQTLSTCGSGYGNTGVGFSAMMKTTTGSNNTGVGDSVLYYNTTGEHNTGGGFQSMYLNRGSRTFFLCTSIWIEAVKRKNWLVGLVGLVGLVLFKQYVQYV
jgi:hypothetical protein